MQEFWKEAHSLDLHCKFAEIVSNLKGNLPFLSVAGTLLYLLVANLLVQLKCVVCTHYLQKKVIVLLNCGGNCSGGGG